MNRLRLRRPSHGTVIAYLALFVALGGGAVAASNLGKNTVGTKQLKKNAVTKAKVRKNSITTPKIKKNAINRSKIKNDAINGAKIADNSVTGSEIDATTTPFSRIVHEARGSTAVDLPNKALVPYPLANAAYTQEPGRDDTFVGAVDVTFAPSCEAPRSVLGYVLLDAANPAEPSETNVVAFGAALDQAGGQVTKRVSLGPYLGASFQPDTPTGHTVSVVAEVECKAGSGATATFGAVDVIGVK